MNNEKRMAGEYEITQAMHIGDREIVMGENLNQEHPYFVADCISNELFTRYDNAMVSDNFIEIAEIYNNRVQEQITQVKIELEQIKVPTDIITADMCYPLDYKKDINGKVVAIKADTLRSEYRRADKQLVLVTGGFGASANSRGNAVFITNLYTGEHSRFERYDIQGEIKELPDWAKRRLKEIQSEKTVETTAKKPKNDIV